MCTPPLCHVRVAVCAALWLSTSSIASASLFEDGEARRAILDLRQTIESQRSASEQRLNELRLANEVTGSDLRRALLDLQSQIEALRSEIAHLRGQDEQLLRELTAVQQQHKEFVQALELRLRKVEPNEVTVDGREFIAQPAEAAEFQAALATFRRGEFVAAQAAFAEFARRYPKSGFRGTALFWLGNAQYANREYQEAIANFRSLLLEAPDHARAPEAVLSIANCQIDLKDYPGARRTLDSLVTSYPQSDAASAAKERLTRFPSAASD
jgi:tol-pal system protein YbgF